ncbi:GNAT family N-acetyltransferase [Nocardia tengchongensis]|uniref:GNAT family N-acetyltransferase n=1 Tax=Nocardia tengchongensis TaxID=2055889 RepID=UPI0036AE21EF
MSDWQVVPLEPKYVYSMSECHIACWREAYQGLVPQHVLDAFDVDRRAAAWGKILFEYPGRIRVAVLDDGTVIGFAGSGDNLEESPTTEYELSALYVRAAYHGTGVAQALMDEVLPETGDVTLWVFEENPRARAFYTKYGFEPDGERRVEAFSPALQVRMVRRALTG